MSHTRNSSSSGHRQVDAAQTTSPSPTGRAIVTGPLVCGCAPSCAVETFLPPMPTALSGLAPDDLAHRLVERGLPAFRATQILNWVWRKKAASFDEMTNLPAALRAALAAEFTVNSLVPAQTQGSADTTRKFLFRLHDGRYVESVLIPANPALYGESSDRHTLCVSSQVGCAYGCKFCASGLAGFSRNLDPGEIAGQVLAARTPVRRAGGQPRVHGHGRAAGQS